MNTGGAFVKAYSNNWLSQFGIYKYENPVEPPAKNTGSTTQHRKIALYGILGMAFVLFFILFVIINKSESDRLQQLIVEAFSNETSIESSRGHTVLTTPFSSNGSSIVGNDTTGQVVEELGVAEARKQRRTRRLGSENAAVEFNDNLVLYPSTYLKPPRPGSMRKFANDYSLAENFQLAGKEKPRPFGFEGSKSSPVGFAKQNSSYLPDEGLRGRTNYGPVNNIQDVLKTLSSTKNQNYKYIPHQPAGFNNPMHRNHRVKFSGIYRHPRKNGDITTLFGASSRQHELQVSKPQAINNQLTVPSVYMPDPLYNFRPANPSDINLLATNEFRFAPENNQGTAENLPKGMPFSIMLDIVPMADGSLRFKRPTAKKKPIQNYGNVNFPSYFNNQNFAQVQHALHNSPSHTEDTYFRSSSSYYRPPPPPSFFPTMKPGKLMVHLNLYPKQSSEASRKVEIEKTALDINHLSLNAGEALPDPERHMADSTSTSLPDFLELFYGVTPPPTFYASTSSTTTAKSTKLQAVAQNQSESFSNENVAMGRYPPYRQIKRRHENQGLQEEVLDPRTLLDEEEPKEDGITTKLNMVSFDANDAV